MKHIELFENYTKSFSNWFEGSKVIDSKKNPLLVYHGTCYDFKSFDLTHGGKSTGGYAQRFGFFFTDNLLVAQSYANWSKERFEKGQVRVIEAYLSIKNPITLNAKGKSYGDYKHIINDAVEDALKKGKDGLIIKNFDDDLHYNIIANQYMVFNHNQIKIVKSTNF